MAIFKLFHLRLFLICEDIIGYFWLLKVISPKITFVHYRLFHLRLFLAILSNFNIWLLVVILLGLLGVINGYGYLFYWWLLMVILLVTILLWLLEVILLMVIEGYYINGYWWIIMLINGYYISGYWWLFDYKPLVVILLVAIDGYWWLFY